ncbi:ABC transporter substrate-binding protein [Alkalicoccobacillus plakortidis]|uniref:ABC transporter substrate-binding protein n=1 Tax=Alkalicoccobacillus plakortidis TaxID=444060 RepID=A0ABT0XKD8_9BACI|nr:ABC transporter substrate-binding protein [Alkalicoccobacillus plakortidis]MCM2676297.1 ABC transporter substrate-binding protein [Alkalicoccobacillus plakortidis]
MARLLNRENEAMTFLETYHTKVEMVKKQIKHKVGSGNILILGIGEGAICVYGQRNLGSVLYNDLHISKPAGVEQIYHVKEISLSDLCMMNPDHILLTIYRNKNRLPSKQAIRNQIVHVQQSPEWNALKAVQQDKIYSILDTNHLYTSYNSFSQHLFLNKMQQLLTERI